MQLPHVRPVLRASLPQKSHRVGRSTHYNVTECRRVRLSRGDRPARRTEEVTFQEQTRISKTDKTSLFETLSVYGGRNSLKGGDQNRG